jgi:hypothetical protein
MRRKINYYLADVDWNVSDLDARCRSYSHPCGVSAGKPVNDFIGKAAGVIKQKSTNSFDDNDASPHSLRLRKKGLYHTLAKVRTERNV